MQEAIERRSGGTSRIPLDTLIELAHVDFEEIFEADGLNIGLGGLALRASVLPEIGTRMSCRFRSPACGESVHADVEVVWAQDSGPHFGEFGMRFTSLDSGAESALRNIVHTWERELSNDEASSEQPSTPEIVEETARLQLEGVATPIVARVLHRASDLLVVEQDLPSLELGKGVQVLEASHKLGRIAAVDLTLVDRTPRLTFVVTWDETGVLPMPQPVREVQNAQPIAEATLRGDGREAPIVFPTERQREQVADEQKSNDERDTLRARLKPRASEAKRAQERAPAPEGKRGELARATTTFVAAWLGTFRTWLGKARPAALAVREEVRPWLQTARELLVRFFENLARHAGPFVRSAALRTARVTQHFVSILHARVAERLPWMTRGPRVRRTAAAPSTGYVPSRLRNAAPEPQRRPSRLRALFLVVIGVVAIALLVYALMPGSDEASIPVHRPIQTSKRASLPTPPAAPAAAVVPPSSAPELGSAQPLAPSSIPPLDQAARPHAPATLPPSSPYAVDVRESNPPPAITPTPSAPAARAEPPSAPVEPGSRSFGAADVPRGRRFVLRMSQPVASLQGMREADGFTVTVVGSLALDPAGPIAAAHPFVRRAMILNQGDRAVLNIRFEDGRRPPYRVVARGSSLEVILGT